MSGSYTQTPNLGLYKPTPNSDTGTWGNHLNANADVLDSAVSGALTDSGGTVYGPLIYTATGGTVPRAAQDRAIDVANVLDFGADPTGTNDSAPAFNAAAAIRAADGLHHHAVYAPAGTYRLNGQVSLTASQTLFGDGRGSTLLTVDQAFSPTASAVISLTNGISNDIGCTVRDLAIRFAQPYQLASRSTMKTLAAGGTSGTGGTGVMYPPAIQISTNAGRSKIKDVQIGGAWIGIQNTSNTPLHLDNIEMGALSIGMNLGTVQHIADFCHVSAYHFWCFGLVDLSNYPYPVFQDGQTIALQLGNVNGFEANGICTYNGRVVFTSDAANGWYHITNLMCDTDNATLEIGGAKFLRIANFYSSSSSTGAGKPRVNVQGPGTSYVIINNWWSSGSGPNPHLAVTYSASEVTVSNAMMIHGPTTGSPCVLVSTGTLRFYNSYILLAAGTYTAPIVSQSGTGVLLIDNVAINAGGGTTTGSAVTFGADYAANYLGHVGMGAGLTINLPASYSLGSYPGLSGNTSVALNSAGGSARQYVWQTGGTNRWAWTVQDSDSGSGSNTGSNLYLQAYSDTGSLLFTPMTLNRSTGGTTLLSTGVTGVLSVVNTTGNYGLLVDGTGNAAGASIRFNGDGATTPTKYIRVHAGALYILSSAGAAIMTLSDAGNLSLTGSAGFNGTAPPAKPTISGACAGNTAIKNLLTALASYGLVTDSTTA